MTIYDAAFYDDIAAVSRSAAEIVLPFVRDLVRPQSVLDIGCGSGEWLKVWTDLGVTDYAGVDGHYVDRSVLLIPPDRFREADLSSGLDIGRRFDLVTSLEVAEHIPPDAAARFVESVTTHADVVLFSAAAPGQGGVDHVNEQWPPYWVDLFAAVGFGVLDVIRPHFWDDDRVIYYYRQNAMLFAKTSQMDLLHQCRNLPSFGGRAVVHPHMYLTYTQDRGVRDLVADLRGAVKRRMHN